MKLTIELTGLNLEKLLSLAAQAGITVYRARRTRSRTMRIVIGSGEKRELDALCARYGWEANTVSYGWLMRCVRRMCARPMLPAAALLCTALVLLSSGIIWRISIVNAGKNIGEVRMFLHEQGIGVGSLKAKTGPTSLREALLLRLPDLAYASVSFVGSTLVIDCQPALDGEIVLIEGTAPDLVAAQDGVITGISVHSGTPVVQIGQAVCAGDVLIRGEERAQNQSTSVVAAQGAVTARVWARGDARVSRTALRTVETGEERRRVTLCTPWNRRVVRDAQHFAEQDVSVQVQPVVGLYLPVWREIETFARIEVMSEQRDESETAAMAQDAAWQIAKNKCPAGVRILDKSVEYSMIDNEFVYATVVLEYERNIAVRMNEHNENDL